MCPPIGIQLAPTFSRMLSCSVAFPGQKSADLYGRQVTGLRSHLSRIRLGEKNRESENEGSRGLFNELMDGYEHKVNTKW